MRPLRWVVGAAAGAGLMGVCGFVVAVAEDATVRVMTYNVRGVMDPAPRDWGTRLPLMKVLLRRHRPDLLGVQEAQWDRPAQMRDLERALPGYGWVGMGRRGGTRDEFSAIFYRRDRFEVLGFDHFWLSDTPHVIGSASWGNRYVRMVTWAKFRDRRGGAVFFHVNTHLDHQMEGARNKGAELILRRVRAFGDVPVVVTGDFNAAAGRSRAYAILTGPDAFSDTWVTARGRGPVYGTMGRWRPPRPGGPRIDWILTRGGVRTLWTEVDPYRRGEVYASDHYPVVAHLQFG